MILFTKKHPKIIHSKNCKSKWLSIVSRQLSITNADEKITDIIERAGGLTNDAFPFGSEFIRGENKINISFLQF